MATIITIYLQMMMNKVGNIKSSLKIQVHFLEKYLNFETAGTLFYKIFETPSVLFVIIEGSSTAHILKRLDFIVDKRNSKKLLNYTIFL